MGKYDEIIRICEIENSTDCEHVEKTLNKEFTLSIGGVDTAKCEFPKRRSRIEESYSKMRSG